MFQRLRDSLKRERKIRAESAARGEAKVYQEVAAWNGRRMEAEARGEKLTEPPPAPPQETSNQNSINPHHKENDTECQSLV